MPMSFSVNPALYNFKTNRNIYKKKKTVNENYFLLRRTDSITLLASAELYQDGESLHC